MATKKENGAGREAADARPRGAGAKSRRPLLDKRVDALERRARKLREAGKAEQAARLEKQAQLLAKHPRVGRAQLPAAHEAALRKRARIKRWHRRYGQALRRPDVQAELRLHGLRAAKLQRMRALAQQKPDAEQRAKLLSRVDELVALERARHGRAMSRLAGVTEAGNEQTPRAEANP